MRIPLIPDGKQLRKMLKKLKLGLAKKYSSLVQEIIILQVDGACQNEF